MSFVENYKQLEIIILNKLINAQNDKHHIFFNTWFIYRDKQIACVFKMKGEAKLSKEAKRTNGSGKKGRSEKNKHV